MSFHCLMTGVGGQGTVLASKLLARCAMRSGLFARTSETIGMAQRGGSVVSHVRLGETESALIPKNGADLIIAFEPAEAVRALPYLKPNGNCVVAKRAIQPITASLSGKNYDADAMLTFLQDYTGSCTVVDGDALTLAAGNPKTLNIILLGVAFGKKYISLDSEAMKASICDTLPQKLHAMNLTAFDLGRQAEGEEIL